MDPDAIETSWILSVVSSEPLALSCCELIEACGHLIQAYSQRGPTARVVAVPMKALHLCSALE
ncbi:hypothetical protein [Methylobacterium fujisawaense]